MMGSLLTGAFATLLSIHVGYSKNKTTLLALGHHEAGFPFLKISRLVKLSLLIIAIVCRQIKYFAPTSAHAPLIVQQTLA